MVVLLQIFGSITQSGIFPSNILGVQVTEILLMLGPTGCSEMKDTKNLAQT